MKIQEKSLIIALCFILLWTEQSESECDDGWTEKKCDCFLFVSEGLPFEEAEEKCESLNSTLVTIRNDAENEMIRDIVLENKAKHAMIGLYENETSCTGFQWTDGSTSGHYFKWDINQPDDHGTVGEDCAMIRANGMWNDHPCNRKYPYICKKKQKADEVCNQGWVHHQCSSYLYVHKKLPFQDAKQTCESMSSHLATIPNQELNDFIEGLVYRNGMAETLIGFYEETAPPRLHRIRIHGSFEFRIPPIDRADTSQFQWVDGSPKSYMNFGEGEPNDWGRGEDCVVIKYRKGWNDVPCDFSYPFVCQRAENPEIDSLTVQQSDVDAKVEWTWKNPGQFNSTLSSCAEHLILKLRYREQVLSDNSAQKLPEEIDCSQTSSPERTWTTKASEFEHMMTNDKTSYQIENLCHNTEYVLTLHFKPKDGSRPIQLRETRFRTSPIVDAPTLHSFAYLSTNETMKILWNNMNTKYCTTHYQINLFLNKEEQSPVCSTAVPADTPYVFLQKYGSCMDRQCHLRIEGMMGDRTICQTWTSTFSQGTSSECHPYSYTPIWLLVTLIVLLIIILLSVYVWRRYGVSLRNQKVAVDTRVLYNQLRNSVKSS